jgi:hypothetical protein
MAPLEVPTPLAQRPSGPKDLVPVPPGHPDHQHALAVSPGPAYEVKTVNVPARRARFDAYKLDMGPGFQEVSLVGSCIFLACDLAS